MLFLRMTKLSNKCYYMAPFLLCVFFLLQTGCGKNTPPPSAPPPLPKVEEFTPPPKLEIPKYSYSGDRYQDPFVPLSVTSRSSAPDELVIPNINSLALKGIYSAGKEKIALLSGGGYSYTSRNGYLYDARSRMIPGYRCVISEDSVRISAGGVSKELKIRE